MTKLSRAFAVLSLMTAACSSSHTPSASGGAGGAGAGAGGQSGTAGVSGGQGGGPPPGSGGNAAGGNTGAGTGGNGTNGTGGATTGAGGGGGVVGTGGATGTNGTGGATGTNGTGGATGTNGTGGSQSVDAGTDAACQSADYRFNPNVPTVFVLVDRSGSEFDAPLPDAGAATTGTYFTLRDATLPVIAQLQSQVRFGFGAFVGSHASGVCAPVFDSVPIALNNSDAIAAKYNSLGELLPPGSKADTPASAVIPMVKSLLLADTGMGQRYLLFVTDGETDFCDDGAAICPTDAMTYRIQDMYAAGISTLIVGLPTTIGSLAPSALQNFANAGTGQTVALPVMAGISLPIDIYHQCNMSSTGWTSLVSGTGHTTSTSLATYGSPGGAATVFAPTSASQDMLTQKITTAVSGVKSCTFNLDDVNGKSIMADLNRLTNAHVAIEGTQIPLDAANGWSMNSPTVLTLNGLACTTWKTPGNNDITFDFPCEAIHQ